MEQLDRHRLDRLARAVVSGQRGHGRQLDRLADALAALMRSRLHAVGAPGAERTGRRIPSLNGAARAIGGRDALTRLVRRVDKHLGPLAQRRARAH